MLRDGVQGGGVLHHAPVVIRAGTRRAGQGGAGLVKTKLAAALWQGAGEDRIAEHIPLRRLGVPDDIATTALFLASEASSWVTGQTLVVDGGTTVQPSGGVG